MSQEKTMLLLIKGAISDFPEEDQTKIKGIASQIRALVTDNAEHGLMTMALVGAESAAE